MSGRECCHCKCWHEGGPCCTCSNGGARVAELEQEITTTRRVLEIVLREMVAYGRAWRADWSNFDGRILRGQLEGLADWASKALIGQAEPDYTYGTQFQRDREGA